MVAVNKMDLADANPDRVKQQLSDLDLIPEEWGGNTVYSPVSAKEGDGGDDLLDMTPYSRGRRSLLAAPVRWRERVIVGGLDGVLYILDAASGACVSETRFGAPISAAPCLMGDGLCVGTWDGRLYCFGG